MLLDSYKDNGLLFNTNFLEASSTAGISGYRGELVLVEGEIADEKGHTKPPVEVMRGATLLAGEKLQTVVGAIDRLELLQTFVDKYQGDFASDMQAVIYVVDIGDAMKVELGGANFVLIPLVQGVPWNEMIDELGLEKSDFKGQSAADKIVTLSDELKSYKPKYAEQSFADALGATTDVKRESWGAV